MRESVVAGDSRSKRDNKGGRKREQKRKKDMVDNTNFCSFVLGIGCKKDGCDRMRMSE